MKKTTYLSRSEMATRKLGSNIMKEFSTCLDEKCLIYLLEGELGTGKTVFVKGIADSLGVDDIISPTFVISCEHATKNNSCSRMLVHMDLYRIDSDKDMLNIGLHESIEKGNVICIEWGERAKTFIRNNNDGICVIRVLFEHISPKKRSIVVEKHHENTQY